MRTSFRRTSAAAATRPSVQPPRQWSDEGLLARLCADDTDALEVALGKYWVLVVDYIARITGSQDAAEDIAQRAFCQLWDRRKHWRAVAVTWSLPARLSSALRVESSAISMGGQNLARWTKYDGWDPEVMGSPDVTTPFLGDVFTTPQSRRVFARLNLQF